MLPSLKLTARHWKTMGLEDHPFGALPILRGERLNLGGVYGTINNGPVDNVSVGISRWIYRIYYKIYVYKHQPTAGNQVDIPVPWMLFFIHMFFISVFLAWDSTLRIGRFRSACTTLCALQVWVDGGWWVSDNIGTSWKKKQTWAHQVGPKSHPKESLT